MLIACPHCKHEATAAPPIKERKTLLICDQCAEAFHYGNAGKLAKINFEEWLSLIQNQPELFRAIDQKQKEIKRAILRKAYEIYYH